WRRELLLRRDTSFEAAWVCQRRGAAREVQTPVPAGPDYRQYRYLRDGIVRHLPRDGERRIQDRLLSRTRAPCKSAPGGTARPGADHVLLPLPRGSQSAGACGICRQDKRQALGQNKVNTTTPWAV